MSNYSKVYYTYTYKGKQQQQQQQTILVTSLQDSQHIAGYSTNKV